MKLRVMITVLTVCCLAAGCHPDPVRSELKELDRIIAARQEYRDLFEQKASPLRAGLDAALDDSIRFELEDSLRNYYLSFSLDSVERYTRKMAVSASTPRQRMKAEISEIRLVALKNMEMTALDLLSQIDTAAYDREGLRQMRLWTGIRLLVEAKHHHTTYHGIPLDSLLKAARLRYAEEDTSSYFGQINRAHLFAEGGNTEKGIAMMERLYEKTENPRWKSIFSNYVAYFSGLSGDNAAKKHWLIRSTVNDFHAANMNYLSLYQLSRILYKEGDYKRAETYMRRSLTDVSVAGFNQRMRFSGPALAVIGDALDREHARNRRIHLFLFLILSILLITVLLLLSILSRRSRMLSKMNHKLQDANKIRDNYIIRYMTLATEYLEEPEKQRRELKQILRSEGPDAVVKKLRQPSSIHARYQDYFKSFDETFLKLYPDFISKVNRLLEEEARFPETSGDLPTELRILAAIRIGITESGEIARFLNCSPSTVYTYRSRMKAAARCEKEDFEEIIKNF